MNHTWPTTVAAFEVFLEKAGLMRQRCEEQPAFNNKVLQYGNATIGVRVVSDRGIWYAELADVASHPSEWYDAAILRDLLLGCGEDVLPLDDQIAFFETRLPAILDRFSPAQSADTHKRLAELRRDRAERRFPGLFHENSGRH